MSIKYIFCITTGRSGSNYLSNLFNEVECCYAAHEEEPIMNGEVMFEYLRGNKRPLRDLMPLKISAIRETAKDKIYIDTTHCFIKGFGWELPKYIPQEEIGVIILTRQKHKVTTSLGRIHCSPFNAIGREWIITPTGKSIIQPPIGKFRFWFYSLIMSAIWQMRKRNWVEYWYPEFIAKSSTELLDWYYDETYALGRLYMERFKNIKYVTLHVDSLNELSGFENLLKELSIPISNIEKSIENVIGVASNQKEHWPF